MHFHRKLFLFYLKLLIYMSKPMGNKWINIFHIVLQPHYQIFVFSRTTMEINICSFFVLFLLVHLILSILTLSYIEFLFIFITNVSLCQSNTMQIFELIFCGNKRYLLTYLLTCTEVHTHTHIQKSHETIIRFFI